MKRVKSIARMMALAVAACMLLSLGVFASESGSVWLSASSAEGSTVASIVADTGVTDGVIAVEYDSEDLTYQDIQINEDYVAMYSVNAEEGEVRIAWVAPGETVIDGEDWLMKLSFTGTKEETLSVSGTVTGASIGEEPQEGTEPSDPSEPADPADPTEATKPGSTGGNGSTGTGDDSNLAMPIILAVVCVAGIAIVAVVMLKGKKGGKE